MNAPPDLETDRLRLTRLEAGDADFIVELLNDPDWLRFIGDKGVADHAGALRYLETGPWRNYREFGFGLLRVGLRDGGTPIGVCGLLRRENRDGIELGFALLPAYRRRGYAAEAARAVLDQARDRLAIPRVEAIVTADNHASRALVTRLGFRRAGEVAGAGAGEANPLDLYRLQLIC